MGSCFRNDQNSEVMENRKRQNQPYPALRPEWFAFYCIKKTNCNYQKQRWEQLVRTSFTHYLNRRLGCNIQSILRRSETAADLQAASELVNTCRFRHQILFGYSNVWPYVQMERGRLKADAGVYEHR